MAELISVCMPYWQRQHELDRSMAAYRKVYADADFELEFCIADDGSPEPVIAPECAVYQMPWKTWALNPCTTVNRAVGLAHGSVIVITNPEIEHREPVFAEMLQRLSAAGIRGYVTASCLDESGAWLAHSSVRGGENGRGPMPEGAQFHFCAMLYSSMWHRAGGFDEAYRDGHCFDDNDWLYRLQDAGAQFVHCDDLVVHHYRTPTPRDHADWTRNEALFRKKWGHRIGHQ